jgi:DnaJ-class molecular chaperone
MQDHYKTLGLNSSATLDEIRRAYRILARRYHPDVNPGRSTEDKFKEISIAYSILSDPKKRQAYDLEYEVGQISRFSEKLKAYQKKEGAYGRRNFQSNPTSKSTTTEKKSASTNSFSKIKDFAVSKIKKARSFLPVRKPSINLPNKKISIIEVSLNIKDAIRGQRKTIEISEPEGTRKVSITIPPGSRTGSVLRLEKKGASHLSEELIIILRVGTHPFLSVQSKGLVAEVPITALEAIRGASITLPTLDEPAVVKIPAGSQSGQEIRLRGRGIIARDGVAGDLFYRLLIKLPEAPEAIGLREKTEELDKYYESPVRRNFPNSLLES